MSSRRSRVALLIRGGSYAYQDEVIIGAHQECSARGVDLACLSGGNVTLADPRNFLYALPDPGALDAAIVVKGTMGADDGDATVAALVDRLRPLPTCMIGSHEPGVPSVVIDNSSGVRALTRHLIEKHDCRRIAFVTGHGREAEQRLAGYRAAHGDRELRPDDRLMIRGDFRFSAGQEAVAQLFDPGGPGCDAIVAANDWMALGALEALRSRGLRVPEDVAVVGFDDVEEARFTTPPLTTVRQAPRRLGIEAVRLVLALARGERRGDTMLETVPQIRQSCGCFRGARRGEPEPPPPSSRGASGPDHAAWVRALVARGPAPDPSLPADWAQRMADAIQRDFAGASGEHFLAAVDEIVGGAAELGNVSAWHQPVATLRREVVRDLGGTASLALAESIFERAHILIGDHAERTQGRRRLETEEASRALEELGTDVRTSLDRPSIGRALAAHLPGLHVRSCAVVVDAQERAPAGDDPARLILVWDYECGLATLADGVEFRAAELMPEAWRPQRRSTLMVQPLCFQTETLGWCLLEMDPPRATVCETIPAQISAALKATALQEQLVSEATKRERAERSRLEHEIELAARIQTSILPRERRVSGLALSAAMIPATEVGGDYFDILPFTGGCWLGIGDVAGHGLHAGLVMMMIQSIVSAITHDRPAASPAEVWTAVNAVLCDNVRARLERDEHATLTLIRYEEDGRCVYAGAHEDILIHRARSRQCERLHTQGVWAGMASDLPAGTTVDTELRLEPGDTVLLHTDGITEARNAAREMFGLERLCRALERAAIRDVDGVRDQILREVRAFTSAQADDMTVVVLRYR
ncbi:MAG TPA: SpoIIE family protein phosphatase [Polyangia bacterium]|jgi:DNA-binding LacI/PurR family transcriptional regulator/serine phosphatase RsbU (regulator of sigma subunit)